MRQRSGGFTLTELIIVIVITGIVATVSVQFVQFSVQGALDTASRQRLAQGGVIISEKLSLVLRNTLPGSIRVTDDAKCIEFIPIKAGSIYRDLTIGAPVDSFEAVAYSATDDVTGRTVVYPIAGYAAAAGNLYNESSPGPISGPGTLPADTDGDGLATVTISTHEFENHSPQRRFFVVDEPTSICQYGRFLYRYRNYGFNLNVDDLQGDLPTTYPDREVLAAPLQADSVTFSIEPPTLQRSGVAVFDFVLEDDRSGETLALSQEVQIRNVP
jgi:MSHA biogenesis protein MshO